MLLDNIMSSGWTTRNVWIVELSDLGMSISHIHCFSTRDFPIKSPKLKVSVQDVAVDPLTVIQDAVVGRCTVTVKAFEGGFWILTR